MLSCVHVGFTIAYDILWYLLYVCTWLHMHMESNGIKWNQMESHGIIWNQMESYGIIYYMIHAWIEEQALIINPCPKMKMTSSSHFIAPNPGALLHCKPFARMESFRVKLTLKFISLVRYPRQEEQEKLQLSDCILMHRRKFSWYYSPTTSQHTTGINNKCWNMLKPPRSTKYIQTWFSYVFVATLR